MISAEDASSSPSGPLFVPSGAAERVPVPQRTMRIRQNCERNFRFTAFPGVCKTGTSTLSPFVYGSKLRIYSDSRKGLHHYIALMLIELRDHSSTQYFEFTV